MAKRAWLSPEVEDCVATPSNAAAIFPVSVDNRIICLIDSMNVYKHMGT